MQLQNILNKLLEKPLGFLVVLEECKCRREYLWTDLSMPGFSFTLPRIKNRNRTSRKPVLCTGIQKRMRYNYYVGLVSRTLRIAKLKYK